MIDLKTELDEKWEEARRSPKGGHEWRGMALSTRAPVRLLAGIREQDDRIALLLEAPVATAPSTRIRFRADGLSVSDERNSEEELFRLAIVLERDELRDVFEVLVIDIINTISSCETPLAAVISVGRRLDAWQTCLRSGRRGLSREEQIGLAGELIVLQQLGEEIGISDALEAWQGPLGGIHDFSRAGIAIEVKSVSGIGNLIHISRLDQLESKGLSSLIMARPRFRESSEGLHLSGMILEMRERIRESEPGKVSSFDEQLLRVGYLDADAAQYTTGRLVLDDIRGYRIQGTFPRFTHSTIPVGIIDGSYTIDERAITAFRMESVQLRAEMKLMRQSRE